MKKNLLILISLVLLPVFVLPLTALAQTTGGAVPESCNIRPNDQTHDRILVQQARFLLKIMVYVVY